MRDGTMKNELRELILKAVSRFLALHEPGREVAFDILSGSIYQLCLRELESMEDLTLEDPTFPILPTSVKHVRENLAIWYSIVLVKIGFGGGSLRRISDPGWDYFERRFLEVTNDQCLVVAVRREVEKGFVGMLSPEVAGGGDDRRKQQRLDTGSVEDLMALVRSFQVDLEIVVETTEERDSVSLEYVLRSPNGVLDYHNLRIPGPTFPGGIEYQRGIFIDRMEKLQKGLGDGGSRLVDGEVRDRIDAFGRELYSQVFTRELRAEYRKFRNIKRLQITTEEPWIPWEMIRPYDDTGGGEPIDDEFLAYRFEFTRWLAGDMAAPTVFGSGRGVLVEAGDLPEGRKEAREVLGLARKLGMDMKHLDDPPASLVKEALSESGLGLFHVIAHGAFSCENPTMSRLILQGDSYLSPEDFNGPLRTAVRKCRPVFFLNACQAGLQGLSLTGLGGWATKCVSDCRCSVFVGPQWSVGDTAAAVFSRVFYRSLVQGDPLGLAAQKARRATREVDPNNPAWLAFHVYGHPAGLLSIPAEGVSSG